MRAVLVLDKTCSYKWYSSRLLIFPRINGPIKSAQEPTAPDPTKDFFKSLVKKLQIPYLCEVSSNLIKTREAPYASRS